MPIDNSCCIKNWQILIMYMNRTFFILAYVEMVQKVQVLCAKTIGNFFLPFILP
jgi:hypothetical protein